MACGLHELSEHNRAARFRIGGRTTSSILEARAIVDEAEDNAVGAG
ncbi:hypothetical protein F441_14293 [Phytophthora nicotianae CJ01A1]|uniref:Uncharacterized protein n=5 Tax=Phytophthora nicotianae TaxID=4792 RepID=V9ELL3_PHYNI|nr:hypothetical protein F443_14415 [Phytophthora nicotianae P1569]ETK80220.1 hypothetical protein L915_14057 [Phytophthora nicotianae]ETO68827.1 hypothetical protein F444_14414 [Phytophthora nicotianae P1976]ETP09939.1 hypothetical protein F441_14293 [Phytophthora nicotianae CJ01A1]ETP38015.1 hypothetical protein F442_14258 [Phytophthora nicotianae P10297]